jgi:putative FmdB family regulatory protein
MPFYEYECQACKFYTEVMQKISDAPLTRCPSCGKLRLKKLVSAPVFRLKGGGWYETDFKSDKESKRNLLGADKEEAKAERKPESKDAAEPAKDAKAGEARGAEAAAAGGKPPGSKPADAARRPAKRVRRRSARRARR